MRSIKRMLTKLTRLSSPYRRSDEPRARRFYSSSADSEFKHTRWMFQEDFQNGIVPLRIEPGADSQFSIRLEGEGQHVNRTRTLLGSVGGEGRWHESEAILEAVRRIGQLLLWRGIAAFEIVEDTDDRDQLYLYEFHFRWLLRLPWNRVQLYSSSENGLTPIGAARLPSKAVFEVRMPQLLGGVRGYRRLMRRLEGVPLSTPEYLLREPYPSKAWEQFDLDAYRRFHDNLVGTLTRRWGWHMRDYDLRRQTEFYYFHRALTMLWANATMRDHIVGELNQLFRRVGYDVAILISGLPTPSELLAHRRQLTTGDFKFAEVNALSRI